MISSDDENNNNMIYLTFYERLFKDFIIPMTYPHEIMQFKITSKCALKYWNVLQKKLSLFSDKNKSPRYSITYSSLFVSTLYIFHLIFDPSIPSNIQKIIYHDTEKKKCSPTLSVTAISLNYV